MAIHYLETPHPVFGKEYCGHCGKLGLLTVNDNGVFAWRCPSGGLRWITEKSAMDVANAIVIASIKGPEQ